MTSLDHRQDVTDDAALGGRLRLLQPRRGHRFGHDAVLLAAATAASPGDRVVELGAGVGLAGLAVAARVPEVSLTLVDVDPALVALARENIRRNGFEGRARAAMIDVSAPPEVWAEAGLEAESGQGVLMNPPFNDPARHNLSPDTAKARAHAATGQGLSGWCAAALRLLQPGGVLTLIWRADGLTEVLAVLSSGFGGVAVMPVHPRAGADAIRILVSAVKGSEASLRILPGLTLNDAGGGPTAEAEAVLREGRGLPLR